jgi:hypothetical protein
MAEQKTINVYGITVPFFDIGRTNYGVTDAYALINRLNLGGGSYAVKFMQEVDKGFRMCDAIVGLSPCTIKVDGKTIVLTRDTTFVPFFPINCIPWSEFTPVTPTVMSGIIFSVDIIDHMIKLQHTSPACGEFPAYKISNGMIAFSD